MASTVSDWAITSTLSPVNFTRDTGTDNVDCSDKINKCPVTVEDIDCSDDIFIAGAQLSGKQTFHHDDVKQKNPDEQVQVTNKAQNKKTASTDSAFALTDRHSSSLKVCKKVELTPLIIDFQRLLRSSLTKIAKKTTDDEKLKNDPNYHQEICVIPGVPNHELLHAVIGLYDVSLSEMTPDILYATVCEKLARTIILIRDVKDVLKELEAKRQKKTSSPNGNKSDDNEFDNVANGYKEGADGDKEEESDENDDVYVDEDEDKPAIFECVYSDTEDEESDAEEEEDEEEDFSAGINTFLAAVKSRRQERQDHLGLYDAKHVHIENRIVGAVTYDKKFCRGQEKVVHLTLIAVRPRFQGWGIGKYLLEQVKDPMVVGQYDSIVVHADNSAIEFFQKYGFNDDMVLNSKWTEFAEQFTNCTLMCFLPHFTGHNILGKTSLEIDVMNMDKEMKKWKEKTLEAYQAQITCVTRLRNEILHLRNLVATQEKLISKLKADKLVEEEEKYQLEKDFLKYRLFVTQTALLKANSHEDEDIDEDISTALLIRDLERESKIGMEKVKTPIDSFLNDNVEIPPQLSDVNVFENTRYMVYSKDSNQPYDHMVDMADFFRVTEEFKASMKSDETLTQKCEVKSINKATLSSGVNERYEARKRTLNDRSMISRLYYCGSLENPKRLPEILKHGFTEKDFTHGEFGRGLYFSLHPSKAAQFSTMGRLLLAEVTIGNVEIIDKKDHTRSSPGQGYDSVITPGRLAQSSTSDISKGLCQEYILFDVNQTLPLHVMDYTVH